MSLLRLKPSEPVLFGLGISFLAGIFFTFISLVLITLLTTTSLQELWRQVHSPLVLSAIWISLETSLAVIGLTLLFGMPVAYFLALKEFKGKALLDTLLDMPIALPPPWFQALPF